MVLLLMISARDLTKKHHQGNLGRPPLLLVVSASELTKISMAMAVLCWERAHHWGGAH